MAMDPAKKEALQKKIVIGLAVVLGGSLVYNLWASSSGGRSGGALVQAVNELASSPQVHVQSSLQEALQTIHNRMIPQAEPDQAVRISPEEALRRAQKYTAESLRDPFKNLLLEGPGTPGGGTPASAGGTGGAEGSGMSADGGFPDIKVQGIVWGGFKPLAVIDNTLYKVGDTVQGVTVSAIERGSVTFSNGTGTAMLSVPREGDTQVSPQ